MVDTIRGNFQDRICSDCGSLGCILAHWGPLLQPGARGNFCLACAQERIDAWNLGTPPKPLGYKL